MSLRELPVRPNLRQLRRQAKDLLRDFNSNKPEAVALVQEHGLHPTAPGEAKLADAQRALARSYGIHSWQRLVLACRLVDAIWEDDVDAVRDLVTKNPYLLHEDARGVRSNWGPPMSHAANLGRDEIIAMLLDLGAKDTQHAFDRACLQGKLDTARKLRAAGAGLERGIVMGPAETLNGDGLEFLLSIGARMEDESGNPLAPVALVLETYSRNPAEKHKCLKLMEQHGIELPGTPPMAVHRGRVDLIERYVADDPTVLSRRFTHAEIFPPELGCHADPTLALCGTPLAGGTLLHLCVDYDEIEIAKRLIDCGADTNAGTSVDSDGFGGHTPLFACVVSQPYRTGLRRDAAWARLLLDNGADPAVRASLRKRLRFVSDERLHEYRDVTPLEWGERFHDRSWVNPEVTKLLRSLERRGP
ncbi:MAG: ankyrin repeat domain-containing protein [Proteobacteria bacterium]|nr:ankyrin repeat domain-containing protein [Pseudomonadota bacterium]